MRTGWLAGVRAGVIVAALVVAGCHSGCHFSSDHFRAKFSRGAELTAPLAGITALHVATNVGKIHLEAAEVTEARIAAAIKVKADTEETAEELAEQVKITAEPRDQTLFIKAVKPSGMRDDQLCVDFSITAPANLALDCSINVGDVQATGFTQRVKAGTNVGTVKCVGLRGPADLQTNVGDIVMEYATDAPAATNATAGTDVGSIEFRGPPQLSAELTASANVGSIDTDRPITVTGSLQHSVRASLGTGEGKIRLTTNVGSIRIR
jgi:hypothetical protein